MRAYRLALYPDIGKGEDQRWDREAPALARARLLML